MNLEGAGLNTQLAGLLGMSIGVVKILEGYQAPPDFDLATDLDAYPVFEKVYVLIKHGTIAHTHFDGEGCYHRLNEIPKFNGSDHWQLEEEMMNRGYSGELHYKKGLEGRSVFIYTHKYDSSGVCYTAEHYDFRQAIAMSAFFALKGKSWEDDHE